MGEKMMRLTFDITKKEHTRLKIAASMMEMSMKGFVTMSIDRIIHQCLEEKKSQKCVYGDYFLP